MDREKFSEYAKRVFGALGGAMTATMIHLGDHLGLYREMAGAGPLDSDALAKRTGLHERWLREWLYQQGAAGVLEYRGEGRFELGPEGTAILADENHPAFGAGFFSHLPQTMARANELPQSFRSGIGQCYDDFGPEAARGIERGLAPWFRSFLVPVVMPRLEGVVPALERGIAAADVGCGAGVALLELAKHFPGSQFHGYDISRLALARADQNLREAGVENTSFHDAAKDPLPDDGRFGLVTTFDCLHDMTDPASVMRGIRGALAADGTWLIADIKSHAGYEENVERNPMAAMMYGTSVMSCMSSAMSEPDGLGLGTLGLHPGLAREMTREAGFSRFEVLEIDHPINAFYAVRP
jgi:2-polyprenyl-3-methyl-5-hydroxy-6-metoxy-1,4-benzoquinol methylase